MSKPTVISLRRKKKIWKKISGRRGRAKQLTKRKWKVLERVPCQPSNPKNGTGMDFLAGKSVSHSLRGRATPIHSKQVWTGVRANNLSGRAPRNLKKAGNRQKGGPSRATLVSTLEDRNQSRTSNRNRFGAHHHLR